MSTITGELYMWFTSGLLLNISLTKLTSIMCIVVYCVPRQFLTSNNFPLSDPLVLVVRNFGQNHKLQDSWGRVPISRVLILAVQGAPVMVHYAEELEKEPPLPEGFQLRSLGLSQL